MPTVPTARSGHRDTGSRSRRRALRTRQPGVVHAVRG
jgi:hypothetical protein